MEDANITEFAVRADREILTGGTVALTYYNQGEEPWASRPFGPDPISGYGCGPTALSMLVSSLTDQDIDRRKWQRGPMSTATVRPEAALISPS